MNKMLLLTAILATFLSAGCHESFDVEEGTGTEGGDDAFDPNFEIDPNIAVSDVTITVHDRVNTMLVVRWEQTAEVDKVRVAFTFENDEWYVSKQKPGSEGTHEEVVLGVPENTEVTIHIMNKGSGDEVGSEAYSGTTESVPSEMPRPVIDSYDETIASPHRWMLGSVDGSNESYAGPFWVFIMDRQGRIVWYYSNLGESPIIVYPRVARDNRYIYFPNRRPWYAGEHFSPKVVKLTLDWKYHEEIEMDLADNADMTDDGSILYNTVGEWYYWDAWLEERLPDGTIRSIWNCNEAMGSNFMCYSNTVNWNPIDDTVLLSYPYPNTVVEIDRATGNMVGVYGDHSLAYDFSPSSWELEFQHYANITPEGTLMVSSHMPNSNSQHAFLEFEIDRASETLTEKWVYSEGNEWADAMGEASYIEDGGGNIIANYGADGVIKEITQDKNVAWKVRFDATGSHMVGHNTMVDDLYALCQGF